MLKKISAVFSKKVTILVSLLVLTFPAVLPLIHKGYFPVHDSIHVARTYEMYRALRDHQFPARWAPDFRYGEPLYNFYAPLPYYAGALIHFFKLSYIDTSKVIQGISIMLSAVTMFFLSKEIFGKLGGIVSAVLYVYAPYHSVDIYVRGALSENVALIFFPLIFLFSYKLSKSQTRKNFTLTSLSLAGLFLTHNIMTVLFFPFYVGWVAFLIFKERKKILIRDFLLSAMLAFGIAASFLLPAFFEKDLVQSSQLINGYYDFRAHFVELSQFFSTKWGYGASVWGPNDGLSFQIGIAHWIALGINLALALLNREKKVYLYMTLFLTLEFLFSLFMQHNKSTPIWLAFPILSYTQFPWRFLGISIFLVSLMGGLIPTLLNKKMIIPVLILTIGCIFYNTQFFHPQFYYSDRTDQDYISPIYLQNEGFIPKDYLPIYIKGIDPKRIDAPRALDGKISVSDSNIHSSWAKINLSVLDNSDIEVPITYFPDWSVYANGKKIALEEPTSRGLIHFKLNRGNYLLSLNFDNTPIRIIGNILSLISLIVLVFVSSRNILKFKKA